MPHFDPDCILCDIAQRRTRAHVVVETPTLLAFVDHAPIRPGHLQIIPKRHYPCFDEMPPNVAGQITRLGQRLARVLKEEYRVVRVAFLFTGMDIAHTHAHLVPISETGDITSRHYIAEEEVTFVPRPNAPPEVLSSTADRLSRRLCEEAVA